MWGYDTQWRRLFTGEELGTLLVTGLVSVAPITPNDVPSVCLAVGASVCPSGSLSDGVPNGAYYNTQHWRWTIFFSPVKYWWCYVTRPWYSSVHSVKLDHTHTHTHAWTHACTHVRTHMQESRARMHTCISQPQLITSRHCCHTAVRITTTWQPTRTCGCNSPWRVVTYPAPPLTGLTTGRQATSTAASRPQHSTDT